MTANDSSLLNRSNNWYVITGGPGSGKTTTVKLLAELGYKTTIENARLYMDMQKLSGRSIAELRLNQREFQLAILNMQVEMEKVLDAGELTFLDRAIPDAHAYYHYLELPEDEELHRALQTISYKKVFVMDCLPIVNDYARTEDAEAQAKIHKAILDVYSALPFPLVQVPVLPSMDRVNFILSNL